ncbi:hypothetical protein BGZ52_010395, partial [Haplosporangium bisporale]
PGAVACRKQSDETFVDPGDRTGLDVPDTKESSLLAVSLEAVLLGTITVSDIDKLI